MSLRKTGFVRKCSSLAKKLFHTRNIIIVSHDKLEHIPISGSIQALLVIGGMGFLCGVSYLAGSYLTAASTLSQRDATVSRTQLEKTRIGAEMDMLKHDLVKLGENDKKFGTYTKMIVAQYGAPKSPLPAASPAAAASALPQIEDKGKLLERISFLENKMEEIRSENDHLVSAIRTRTDKKIAYFEDIISMTGLNQEKLERLQTARTLRQAPARDAAATAKRDAGAKKEAPHGDNQGGPFIPYDAASLDSGNRDLVENVERLVVLHDIVGQLPLRQPVPGAHMTGPFGKRIDPINGRWAIHPGVDLVGPVNGKIYSTSAGKVVSAGRKSAYGNAVDIDHGFGIVTRYGHLSRVLVQQGQLVKAGQVIGLQGSTGRSTGQHLHYEVRINDHPVNPVKFLHAGDYVFEK